MTKLIALFLLICGLVLVANVTYPIVSYEITKRTNQDARLLSPVGDSSTVLGEEIDWSKFVKTSNLLKASNWFEGGKTERKPEKPGVKYYNLSIPKLKINKATVEIDGEDLAKNLVHYSGTALPGEKGNAVVLGHSILPQFFNPKNYLSIFSTLPTIKKGDEITISYDGMIYTYRITELFEVPPTAIEVLEQYYDGSHLTLITCVPPGTYLRRLVVRADLINPEI